MLVRIPVDVKTIHKNPSFGHNSYGQPVEITANGEIIRELSSQIAEFYWKYEKVEMECEHCKGKFLHTELKEIVVDYDAEEDVEISIDACPLCDKELDIEFEFENYTTDQLRYKFNLHNPDNKLTT